LVLLPERNAMDEIRPLTASDLERILKVYLKLVQELPADTPAGHLDAQGQLPFAPDIGAKLRASRQALDDMQRIRNSSG
jgi:hypothetical protein